MQAVVVLVLIVAAWSQQYAVGLRSEEFGRLRRKDDPHGGVPMGVSNYHCDDAKHNIEVDWNPTSAAEYTCDDGVTLDPPEFQMSSQCTNETHAPIHVCLPTPINYPETEIPPTSGRHRPLWPDYGEYKYVPPQRWLHNLEHGAVVFLYHPCADPQQVQQMRQVATSCLRKHIITPYKKLPPERPFAAVSWGCKLLMSRVSESALRQFVKDHALHSPEGNVASRGQYRKGLTVGAKVVSDYHDGVVCPEPAGKEKGDGHDAKQTGPMKAFHDHRPAPSRPIPNPRPRYPYLLLSQRRRQRMDVEAEKLQRNVQRLLELYRGLSENRQ